MIEAIVMMLIVGGVLGLVLGIAGEAFYVAPDKRFEEVLAMLPGINCGACGYPGCAGMADGLIAGEVTHVSQCKPSKQDARELIANYLSQNPGPDGKVLNVKP